MNTDLSAADLLEWAGSGAFSDTAQVLANTLYYASMGAMVGIEHRMAGILRLDDVPPDRLSCVAYWLEGGVELHRPPRQMRLLAETHEANVAWRRSWAAEAAEAAEAAVGDRWDGDR
jgi:hypothetical protein